MSSRTLFLTLVIALVVTLPSCGGARPDAGSAEGTETEEAAAPAEATPEGPSQVSDDALQGLPEMATEALAQRDQYKGDAEAMKAFKEGKVAEMKEVIGDGLVIPVEQVGFSDVFEVLGAKVVDVRWQPGENPNLIVELNVKGIQERGSEAVPCEFLDAAGDVIDRQDFYLPTGKRLFVDSEKALVAYQTYGFHAWRDFARIVVVSPPSSGDT